MIRSAGLPGFTYRRLASSGALLAALLSCAAIGPGARADEGMWLPNAFPSDRVAKQYGFTPDQPWLDHVRLASARLAQGCSGSFVSARGLVMTNHHCVHQCIEELSTPKKDLVASGFTAAGEAQERRCPALEVNQLVAIDDVSQTMATALANKSGAAFSAAKKAQQATLEKACAASDELRCEVVELYHGGRYHLYKYRRFQDVRLAFAPELGIAFFGGDPDNFDFPRYDLDVAFLRIYHDGKPAQIEHFFPFSPAGAAENQLTFTSGHPGRTSRELTVEQLLFERRVRLPRRLWQLAELRGQLVEFGKRGKEQARYSKGLLFGVENSIKALKGRLQALLDGPLIQRKRAEEKKQRAQMAASKRQDALAAFGKIDAALAVWTTVWDRYDMLERGTGFGGDLFGIARTLVRAADELPKPNDQRLRELSDAALPALKQELLSPAPIYPDFETLQLGFSLTKLREVLTADDPAVKLVLGTRSPERLAAELVRGSKLADVALRKRLLEGGKAAIEASKDPMIVLARKVDPSARAVRQRYEDEVEGPLSRGYEAIARARFELYGTKVYPDATFTLRYSYGAVKGWPKNGVQVPPFTYLSGAYERHTGEDPFALPKSWLAAKSKLKLDTPFNFVTTNDIVGGNSGSPVIDQQARIVGLIFDGNLPSLGGDYGYEEPVNRAVAVHSSAILEALRKIYAAGHIADELTAPK